MKTGSKKVLTILLLAVLSLALLAGCSGEGNSNSESNSSNSSNTPSTENNSGNSSSSETDSRNDTNDTASQDADVILPSQLITLEDASRLLGEDVEVDEEKYDVIDTLDGQAHIVYNVIASPLSKLQVYFYQDALMDPARVTRTGGAKGRGERSRSEIENLETAIQIDGIGDWAYIDGLDKLLASISIGYGDYYMQITTNGKPADSDYSIYSDEHAAWRKDILTEAGKLAVERIKSLT